MTKNLFKCPVCNDILFKDEKSYKCPNNHSFDISKYGYVNLLSANSGGIHGDNREMISARRNFLDTGLYSPLKDGVVKLTEKYYTGGEYLDCGCGEGYYTSYIKRVITSDIYGIDISKDALRFASKKIPDGKFAVASCYDLPFKDDCFSLMTLLFSPLAANEFKRVLKKDGIMIMAIPGEYHLYGLKTLLYKTPYKNEVMSYSLDGFEFLEAVTVDYTLDLDKENAEKLFKMTPYYYRTPKEGKERLLASDRITTDISFRILCYRVIK